MYHRSLVFQFKHLFALVPGEVLLHVTAWKALVGQHQSHPPKGILSESYLANL